MPTFKGLGISLTPNGIISAIEPNSPSDIAGLRKDNRIVEVNGVNVSDKSNKEIAKIIKENENNLVIGVLDTNLDRGISTSNNNLKNIMADISTMPPTTNVDKTGSGNLKSIMGEVIQTTNKQPAYPYPAPTYPQVPVSESMPNIKQMIADITRMQAPNNVEIQQQPTTSSQKISGLYSFCG